jgi:hypothetical protein
MNGDSSLWKDGRMSTSTHNGRGDMTLLALLIYLTSESPTPEAPPGEQEIKPPPEASPY